MCNLVGWATNFWPSTKRYIYICIYVSMYVSVYLSIKVCMHGCMYVCMYACMYVCMYVWMDVCMYIEAPPSRLHFSYADAAPKAGPGGSAVWAQADWQSNALSTTELWGNQLQRSMFGKAGGRKQARGVEPHVDKLQGDHATRNYCPSNPHVNKGSPPSHLWLRPYVPITPLQPACK